MNNYSTLDDRALSRKVAECLGYRVQEICADDGEVFWEMLDPQGEPCDAKIFRHERLRGIDKGFLGITPEQLWEMECHPSFATDMQAAMTVLEKLRRVDDPRDPTSIAHYDDPEWQSVRFEIASGYDSEDTNKRVWYVGYRWYEVGSDVEDWYQGFRRGHVSLPRAICELFLDVFGVQDGG